MQVVKLSAITILSQDAFGSGGQAHVRRVVWRGRDLLFKEYKGEAPAVAHLERIAALGSSRYGKDVPAAFPLGRVVDDTGRTLGVLMEAAGPDFLLPDGSPRHLKNLDYEDSGGRWLSDYSDGHRLGVMGCYLRAILRLHQAGIVVGDVKEANLLVADASQMDPDRRILLVDCDSFVCVGFDSPDEGFRTFGNLPEPKRGAPPRELDELTDFYQFVLLTERVLARSFAVPALGSVWGGLEGKLGARQFEIARRAKRFEHVKDYEWWELADAWSAMWSTAGISEYRNGVKERVRVQAADEARVDGPPRPRALTKRARGLWARVFLVLAMLSGLLALAQTVPVRGWLLRTFTWLPSAAVTVAWWVLVLGTAAMLVVAWWQWLKSGWSDCRGRGLRWIGWEAIDSRSVVAYLGYLLPALVVVVAGFGGHWAGTHLGGGLSLGGAPIVVDPIDCTEPAFAANLEVALVGSFAGACSTAALANLTPGTTVDMATWVLLTGTYAEADLQSANVTVTFGNSGDGGVVPVAEGLEVSVGDIGWAPYSPSSISDSSLGVDFPVDGASAHLAVRFLATAVAPGECADRPAESTIDIHAVYRGTQADGTPWMVESNALRVTVLTGCAG